MQKITPFLWFDTEAEAAVHFYTALFPDSKVGTIQRYDAAGAEVSGRPEGSVMTVGFELCGQEFAALNGGPIFHFTPAISFFVSCATEEELDRLWSALSEGGSTLMEVGEYPFSKKYGWLNDKYGVSWQLNLATAKQKIAPALLFVGEQYGRAEEAINFYTSLFPDSGIIDISRHAPGGEEKEGAIAYAAFTLCGQEFKAMEGKGQHEFTFSLATSFVVNCETQDEIDAFWSKLSAVKESEQCGWLQDKFGVSWQIVPTILDKLLNDPDKAKAERAMKAMLQMKKLDISELKRAAEIE